MKEKSFRDGNNVSVIFRKQIYNKALIRAVDQPMCNNNVDTALSLDKVSTAISAMKNFKTLGSDVITAEIFKYAGEILPR